MKTKPYFQKTSNFTGPEFVNLKFNVTNFLINFLINTKTSQFFSVYAVFVVYDFAVWLDIFNWRVLRHNEENLLQRHCDGVYSERREPINICRFRSRSREKNIFDNNSHSLPKGKFKEPNPYFWSFVTILSIELSSCSFQMWNWIVEHC